MKKIAAVFMMMACISISLIGCGSDSKVCYIDDPENPFTVIEVECSKVNPPAKANPSASSSTGK